MREAAQIIASKSTINRLRMQAMELVELDEAAPEDEAIQHETKSDPLEEEISQRDETRGINVSGTWNTTLNTPMGVQNGTLKLATDGVTLTGMLLSPQGELKLSEGTVDGDNLNWKVDITTPLAMTLEFSATVDGDSMTGSVKLGAFGNASFTATRG